MDNIQITPLKPDDTEFLKINKNKRKFKGLVKVFSVVDGEFFVSIMPSLSLSGYGKTRGEADEMLKDAMNDLFDSFIKLKNYQLTEELKRLGWEKQFFNKNFKKTASINKDGVLKDFELPADTIIEESNLALA